MKEKPSGAYLTVDRAFQRFTRWLVYIGAAILIGIMAVAFVDVIIAKLFGSSIQFTTEIITYCDVPLAYLGMGYTLLIGQMTSVDILFGKFSAGVQRVLLIAYDVLGVGFSTFLGKLALDNTISQFANNTMCNPKGGFPVWPFGGLETLSWFVLAAAFLFCLLRLVLGIAADMDGKEAGAK